ncbi:MAG: class I SAM-dependent methyltransferase [Anaerolineaceae bacterium]|nr:class I SAM-dependent methyltransferase [Anaerolineaceae bacterium]
METEKVHLTKDRETYLPTLYGKALDSRVKNSILGDTYADEVVRKIDFDFDSLHLPSGGEITLPMRAKHLDGWAREFLKTHPQATVLNLGCGLDSRVFRMDPPATVRWYDVDLPDVIELRKQLYPLRPNYQMIGTSVTDLGWLDGIAGDLPVMVVAEGLMQYLDEKEAMAIFNRLTEQFPSGQIVFDAYNRFTTRLITLVVKMGGRRSRLTAAGGEFHLPWGLDDPHTIELAIPHLRLVDAVPFLTLPELTKRLSVSRYQRVVGGMMGKWGWYQRSMRHYRFEF